MTEGEWDDLKERLEKIEARVDGLVGFQRFVMGVMATGGAIIGFLADPIRKKLGLG